MLWLIMEWNANETLQQHIWHQVLNHVYVAYMQMSFVRIQNESGFHILLERDDPHKVRSYQGHFTADHSISATHALSPS